MPGNSRIAAWFGSLVMLGGTVLLLEYMILFRSHNNDSEFRQTSELPHISPIRRLEPQRTVASTELQPPLPTPQPSPPPQQQQQQQQQHLEEEGCRRLAVVVPTYAGDMSEALASLAKWPSRCHSSTLRNVDLVLYYAGGDEDRIEAFLPQLSATGGRCFATTRVVLANLSDEENVYPKGPSVQFYKLFLDEEIRKQFAEYDALALIEWDVIVAHETSFEKLYRAAFGGVEPFWMKGSTLDGVNFHETVVLPDQRHILGHINGNAIYNNTDPAFVEFVSFTLTRWEYSQSYDVALWATIADFPYSWPLWQRYSRKFVATDLIANVGFLRADNATISNAVASDTLFIHGSLTGGGGSMFMKGTTPELAPALRLVGEREPAGRCSARCGSSDPERSRSTGTSTVCDRSCDESGEYGARFGGFLCGAGDSITYGRHCRTCYEDVAEAEAAMGRIAERQGGLQAGTGDADNVIMCDTLLPPPSRACSDKCHIKVDTVCDLRCGSGQYGDYNCNWRGYGDECRFCFTDRLSALAADAVAKRRGGRVIMCHTYQPPTEVEEWLPPPVEEKPPEGDVETKELPSTDSDSSSQPAPLTPDMEPYTDDITRGQLCVFLVGYRAFLPETHVAVKSIRHFMPGMRIAIATSSSDFSVFKRTLGALPEVVVSEAPSPVALSPLLADRHCGEGTRLIYYMGQGELLSRTFTSKDTHSVRGELLVVYAEVSRVGKASHDRTLATAALLGFSSPSFSFGMDIVLPAETNQQLRDVLLSEHEAEPGRHALDEDAQAVRTLEEYRGVFIPEVLAALSYSRNPPGMWFVNPQQWVTHHMFRRASIWDIPLVKPRFGCAFDISMAAKGFDVATELDAHLGHFISRGTCERGFIALDRDALRPQKQLEFGYPTNKSMPSMEGLSVSVVYHVDRGVVPYLFDLSLSSVIARFPGAAEVVIVLNEPSLKKDLLSAVESNIEVAGFPIEVVEETGKSRKDDREWSALRADSYCRGDFILHLDAGHVLIVDVTYENMFHFGKPVLPFTRLDTDPLDACLEEAMSFAVGKPVVHDFALVRTPVFPRRAYEPLRKSIRELHKADVESVIGYGHSSCKVPKTAGKRHAAPTIPSRLYEVSLMGSFLWHNMHDAVHWRAFHTLDIQPDEWLSDMEKYDLTCDLNQFELPTDDDEARRFAKASKKITSRDTCNNFQSRWRNG